MSIRGFRYILALFGVLAAGILSQVALDRVGAQEDTPQKMAALTALAQNPAPQTPKKGGKDEDPVPVTPRETTTRTAPDAPLGPNQFGTFYLPQINKRGDIAFVGRYLGPTPTVAGQAIFVRLADGTWKFYRESDKAKNLNESAFGFGHFTLNDNGDVAFIAAFGNKSPLNKSDQPQAPAPAVPGSPTDRNSGLFMTGINGFDNLLQLGQEVPNMPSRFATFSNPSVNSQGTIAFIASYVDPDGRGLFLWENGQLKIIARSGQKIAANEKIVFSEHYYPSRINERGEIAFLCRVGVGAGIFVARPSGIEMLAIDGRPSPVKGADFLGFGNRTPTINDKGEVVYVGYYGGPKAGRALFMKGVGPARLVVSTNDVNSKFKFTDFQDPDINNNGEVAFVGRLEGRQYGIFVKKARGVEAVAVTGELPSGMEEGAEYNNFAQGPSINDRGEVVFYAQLKNNRIGLFIKDAKGVRPLVMRGDPLPFKNTQ
jgi:hypothetical protein